MGRRQPGRPDLAGVPRLLRLDDRRLRLLLTAISFDPAKQADTIRKQGGFIPGIRPGPQTGHLARILSRITFPGTMFIAAVALVPSILIAVTIGTDSSSVRVLALVAAFGGISLLIATGVALETMKQIDSQLMMRNYEGFLK